MNNRSLFFIVHFLILDLLCISCFENKDVNPQELNNYFESLETSTGVILNFSDFGKSKLMLKAPKLIKSFSDNEQIIMECPEGLELVFYDSLKNIESTLIADYGKLFSEKQLLLVKDNVRFDNYNFDTLFAQELEIDFAKDSIYSEKIVTFSNKEGKITGKNLKSNSSFTFFELSNISESHLNYNIE